MQTKHPIIKEISMDWLRSAPEAEALKAIADRELLIRFYDEQRPNLVVPVISAMELRGLVAKGLPVAVEALEHRAKTIAAMEEDPYLYGWEPVMWRKILLYLAKKRLELGAAVLVAYVLGGMRSGKTELGGRRAAQHVAGYERHNKVGKYETWAWCMHQTEPRSKAIGQKTVHDNLPLSWRGSKVKGGKLKYQDGTGFTANMFILNKRFCEFLFYGVKDTTLQGSELTFVWSDETVPAAMVKTLNERLTTRAAQAATREHLVLIQEAIVHLEAGRMPPIKLVAAILLGVHIITFTPKEGWTTTVARAVDGSTVIEREGVEKLPVSFAPDDVESVTQINSEFIEVMLSGRKTDDERIWVSVNEPRIQEVWRKSGPPGVQGWKTVPRVRQCKARNEMVFYIHTKDNPFGGYEALAQTVEQSSEDERRITLYGDVGKGWYGAFPRFSSERHVVKLSQVPRRGTFFHRVDPCPGRNWYWIVTMCAIDGRRYVVAEWPRNGDYVPGFGDPGDWAVASESQKKDGDMGPAQKRFGLGYAGYAREMARIELQLGAWYYGGVMDPWSLTPEQLQSHRPIRIFKRSMDSRAGHNPTPTTDASTTIIDDMMKKENGGLDFMPAPGEHLDQGDDSINNALSNVEGDPMQAPGLFVCEHCHAMRFTLGNYTGEDGKKGACKDPRDALVFDLADEDARYVEEGLITWRGGGSF